MGENSQPYKRFKTVCIILTGLLEHFENLILSDVIMKYINVENRD